METMKMTKNDAATLYNGLVDVKDLKSKKFALKVAKNMTTIKLALQDIEDFGKPSKEFLDLSQKVQNIIQKDPDNGKEEVQKLEEENKELVQNRRNQLDEVNKRLLENIELELNILSEEILPEEITADQINKLIKIIK